MNYMSKNPLINAISASGYILFVVGLMNFVSETQRSKPDNFLAPIILLSVLTLSVTVMAYIFFYQPLQLFISGKKKEAVNLFTGSVAYFAGITVFFFILLFSGIIK